MRKWRTVEWYESSRNREPGLTARQFAQVVDALRREVQRCARVPEHLNRASHIAVTINQALTLEQRVPVILGLVCPDDEHLGANTMQALP